MSNYDDEYYDDGNDSYAEDEDDDGYFNDYEEEKNNEVHNKLGKVLSSTSVAETEGHEALTNHSLVTFFFACI